MHISFFLLFGYSAILLGALVYALHELFNALKENQKLKTEHSSMVVQCDTLKAVHRSEVLKLEKEIQKLKQNLESAQVSHNIISESLDVSRQSLDKSIKKYNSLDKTYRKAVAELDALPEKCQETGRFKKRVNFYA